MKCCQANVYVVFACRFRKGGEVGWCWRQRGGSHPSPSAPRCLPPRRPSVRARTNHEEYPHRPLRFQYSTPNCIQLQHFWTNRKRIKRLTVWTKILKGFQYFLFAFVGNLIYCELDEWTAIYKWRLWFCLRENWWKYSFRSKFGLCTRLCFDFVD